MFLLNWKDRGLDRRKIGQNETNPPDRRQLQLPARDRFRLHHRTPFAFSRIAFPTTNLRHRAKDRQHQRRVLHIASILIACSLRRPTATKSTTVDFAASFRRPHLFDSIGRGGAIRTPDPLRPRQVRYQAALRPDNYCFLDSKPLSKFPILSRLPKSSQNTLDRGKTVTKPHQLSLTVSKPGPSSFAFRFNFCRASRFICNFICEYFLNTFASPCRSNCVTHSSATPPALKRVA